MDDAGFYGHLVLADVPLDDPMQFANQTLYYSEHALLFNRRGERFIDETLGDHLSVIAALEQPDARVLVVADQRVRDEWMLGEYVEGITPVDRFDLCRRRGGRYALADSLDDFDYLPDDWGYPGEVIRADDRALQRRRSPRRAAASRADGSTRSPSTSRRTTSSKRRLRSRSPSAASSSTTGPEPSTATAVRFPVCWPPAPTPVGCSSSLCRRAGRRRRLRSACRGQRSPAPAAQLGFRDDPSYAR